MDLHGIFHMVDRPSSSNCEFNHIYVVGLIVSILIHFLINSVHIGFHCLRYPSKVHDAESLWHRLTSPILTVYFLTVSSFGT